MGGFGGGLRIAVLAVALSVAGASPGLAADVVLTALQPLFSLATIVAKGTDIAVQGVPSRFPGMGSLPRALARSDPALDGAFRAATAVISIDSVWPEDPLYREVRSRNIKIVRIDAARSMDKSGSSVAMIERPASRVPWRSDGPIRGVSPYVWFSPSNAIKMAGIVAADLKRLSPASAARIDSNLAGFTTEMQALRADYDARIAHLADTRVFALTDRFVYLTNEFGFDVEGYFLEDDIRWTAADLKGFADLLRERGIGIVVHHWEPAEPIRRAIAEGGARLVVLADGDGARGGLGGPPDPHSVPALIRANLDALVAAMAK